MKRETTTPLLDLPKPGNRKALDGLRIGDTVAERQYGRRMRVLSVDEYVICSYGQPDQSATGPYARLQAIDDPSVTVIWPRAWYVAAGEQLELMVTA